MPSASQSTGSLRRSRDTRRGGSSLPRGSGDVKRASVASEAARTRCGVSDDSCSSSARQWVRTCEKRKHERATFDVSDGSSGSSTTTGSSLVGWARSPQFLGTSGPTPPAVPMPMYARASGLSLACTSSDCGSATATSRWSMSSATNRRSPSASAPTVCAGRLVCAPMVRVCSGAAAGSWAAAGAAGSAATLAVGRRCAASDSTARTRRCDVRTRRVFLPRQEAVPPAAAGSASASWDSGGASAASASTSRLDAATPTGQAAEAPAGAEVGCAAGAGASATGCMGGGRWRCACMAGAGWRDPGCEVTTTW
mmetsp:Transcript_18710/g.71136  ORF Transcript_18710/g.71136 Transcript_18710/m.71136 type:complete len:310 (-) Transcript_18710:844-1773(-)